MSLLQSDRLRGPEALRELEEAARQEEVRRKEQERLEGIKKKELANYY